METFRLISMIDFVLEREDTSTLDTSKIDWYDLEQVKLDEIRNYARFLKKPLQLGFFVPTDLENNILPEPQMRPERNSFDEEDMDYDAQELYEYIQAKEKVLFEGFNADKFGFKDQYYVKLGDNKDSIYPFPNVKNYTIEDLAHLKIELTENAIKQIGL